MSSKKVLQAEICQLNDELVQLYEENSELTSKLACFLDTLNKQNNELVRFHKENAGLVSQQTELLNALQRKQNQLDDEIASRLDFEGMYQSLKKANFDQSKKIVTLLNALNSLRTRLYLVCDSVGTAVVDIDKAFDPPV